jgi:hypothetical protein
MKLCKDCSWIRPQGPDLGWALCGHPAATYTNTSPVDGTERKHRWPCEFMRAASLPCGEDGKLWEPKEAGGGFV